MIYLSFLFNRAELKKSSHFWFQRVWCVISLSIKNFYNLYLVKNKFYLLLNIFNDKFRCCYGNLVSQYFKIKFLQKNRRMLSHLLRNSPELGLWGNAPVVVTVLITTTNLLKISPNWLIISVTLQRKNAYSVENKLTYFTAFFKTA